MLKEYLATCTVPRLQKSHARTTLEQEIESHVTAEAGSSPRRPRQFLSIAFKEFKEPACLTFLSSFSYS